MPMCEFNKVSCNFIEITPRHDYSPVKFSFFGACVSKYTDGISQNLQSLSPY